MLKNTIRLHIQVASQANNVSINASIKLGFSILFFIYKTFYIAYFKKYISQINMRIILINIFTF